VTSLRRRISDRLLREAARLALDRRDMDWKLQRSGVRRPSSGDLQVLAMLDLVGAAALRLGMLIMPKQPPTLTELAGPPDRRS
jgi:hypothetical protein